MTEVVDGGTVDVIVPDVPSKIRTALIKDAMKQGVSVNEVAARILAAHCQIEREHGVHRFVAMTTDGRMTFRVPAEVRRCLRIEAAEQGATIRGLVIQALAAPYGIDFNDTTRRPRK